MGVHQTGDTIYYQMQYCKKRNLFLLHYIFDINFIGLVSALVSEESAFLGVAVISEECRLGSLSQAEVRV